MSQVPALPPHILTPCFDLEVLKKVGATIDKVSAYLDKAGAVEWWKGWIKDANTWTDPQILNLSMVCNTLQHIVISEIMSISMSYRDMDTV